jgi:hypothetical protein
MYNEYWGLKDENHLQNALNQRVPAAKTTSKIGKKKTVWRR